MIILFLLILLALLIYQSFKIEHFQIVGYNTSNVPNYTISNQYDINSQNVQAIFNKISKKEEDLDTSSFILYSNYIEFPLNNIIKNFLADFLSDKLNNKIYINTNIHNMYWKDTNTDRLFIFNVSMFNRKEFTTRNLKIKIIIKDIKKFTKNNFRQDYKTNISPKILVDSIDILSISLDTNNNINTIKQTGIDILSPEYYRIQNRLSLMDPFITSNKDMIISNNMKDVFNLSLKLLKKV